MYINCLECLTLSLFCLVDSVTDSHTAWSPASRCGYASPTVARFCPRPPSMLHTSAEANQAEEERQQSSPPAVLPPKYGKAPWQTPLHALPGDRAEVPHSARGQTNP